jgi:NAD(P)H-hydrate epimerase
MENAGRACADAIAERFPTVASPRVLVLVGPGNNGGDGLVVARHLADGGRRVTVYSVSRAPSDDAKTMLLRQRDVPLLACSDDPDLRVLEALLAGTDIVVDGLLGASRLRPVSEPLASVMDRVNARSRPFSVVAVDVPSGINADTGEADPHAVRADLTVTLGCPKRGLFLGSSARLVGELTTVDIGIPVDLAAEFSTDLVTVEAVLPLLPDRPRVSHKGRFGRVLIVAGSRLYTGAPVLAALGAERVGAGLVSIACAASIRDSLAMHTVETTFLPLPDGGAGELTPAAVDSLADALADYQGALVGPGIGRSPSTEAFLLAFLERMKAANFPTIVDADGLTLLARNDRWWERLPGRTVLTPHPGEMSRLTGLPEATDRIDTARRSAVAWKCVVVLKGPYSVIGLPDGQAHVLPFANPALATAGTGDVLAGTVLGLIGQGLSASPASLVGAFLNGVAGDLLRQDVGVAGGLAREVAEKLPQATRFVAESRDRSLSMGRFGW